jgi:fermentation-respiration switch protein FrsA (DUF1100 family)
METRMSHARSSRPGSFAAHASRSAPFAVLATLVTAGAAACAGGTPAPAATATPAARPLGVASPPAAAPEAAVLGTWSGTLVTPSESLRLRMTIRGGATTAGPLRATLTSLDQGNAVIRATQVTFANDRLELEVAPLRAGFSGKLVRQGGKPALIGSWTQNQSRFPLTFYVAANLPPPRRPQVPRPPFPYRTEEVIYDSTAAGAAAGVKLAATLTLPPGPGPFPAVLLITGSGPQDRDETVFGHKPFLILADHLARQGIASLRADDRGVARSTGNFGTATTADFVDDALGGVAFLRTRAEIDGRRIGLVGHSEGGVVAPLAATRSRQVAFIVLLAGPGLPGEKVLYLQGWKRLERTGAPAQVVARERNMQEQLYAVLKRERDNARAAEQIRAAWAAAGRTLPAAAQARSIAQLTSPWFRFFLGFDPRPVLRKVRCPVLALNGEKDSQVTAAENLPAIEAALREGGNRDFTVQVLPGLNHLFQTAPTGAVTEYGALEETFAPAALVRISSWITARRPRP